MAASIFEGLERINNADLDKLTALIKKIIEDLEKAKKGQDDAAAKKKKEEEEAAKKKKEEGDSKKNIEDDEALLKRILSALETAKKRGLLK